MALLFDDSCIFLVRPPAVERIATCFFLFNIARRQPAHTLGLIRIASFKIPHRITVSIIILMVATKIIIFITMNDI